MKHSPLIGLGTGQTTDGMVLFETSRKDIHITCSLKNDVFNCHITDDREERQNIGIVTKDEFDLRINTINIQSLFRTASPGSPCEWSSHRLR